MALTSDDVVQHGIQVIDQVNRLAEKMNTYQVRLEGLSSTFDTMSSNIDAQEAEISATFTSLAGTLAGEATQKMESVGSTLEESIQDPTVEAVTNFMQELDSKFEMASDSNQATNDRLEEWRDTDLTDLMTNHEELNNQMTSNLNDLIEKTGDEIESMADRAQLYSQRSQEMLSELSEFVSQTVSSVGQEQSNYGETMLDSYVSSLTETMDTTHEFLKQAQLEATENNFNEISASFDDLVMNAVKPLVDQLVETVGEAVDEMIADVEKIGNDANDKTQALDAVTGVLESLISPIRDIIDRTSAIKRTVDAFL